MEFVHPPYEPGETIAAIATAPGEGGIAIIRISGDSSLEVADRIFTKSVPNLPTHTVQYGHLCDLQGARVDAVLAIVMRAPRSYTGEDTVEIHCHGGSLMTRRVLEVILSAGARAARPGEFTFRAFMNGKMDLAQAEAVQELVSAKNDYALNAADQQLQGALTKHITALQSRLTEIAAILEAWVDFPEEGLEFASTDEVCADLESIAKEIEKLISTFHDGKIIHEGVSLCLVGSPNVGKSSLMNALLEKERAIVSHIPGTTRDILEDHLRLNGLNIRLIDTAGIRQGACTIEKEGIARSRGALEEADIVLLVLDASRPLESEDEALIHQVPSTHTIGVWNKTDLPHKTVPTLPLFHTTQVSAKCSTGLSQLKETIDHVIWNAGPPSAEEIVITNVRHKEALEQAHKACLQVLHGLRQETSPEFITLDMRHCLNALGTVIGTNIGEDILSAIFSKFCIGK